MRGKEFALPVGDRDEEEKPVRPEPEPVEMPPVAPPREGEGFGSWLARIDRGLSEEDNVAGFDSRSLHHPMPTSETVRKTDAAMARTAKGLCPFCAKPVNEDGRCEEETCR